MNRRGFLKFFGIGAATTAVKPSVMAEAALMASRMPSPKFSNHNGQNCKILPTKATGAAINPGQTVGFVGDKGSRKMATKWDDVSKRWVG